MAQAGESPPRASHRHAADGPSAPPADLARRCGLAGIAAGALFFLGQGGELVFGDNSKPILVLVVALLAVAILAFGVAFWLLRALLQDSRSGRIGATVGLVGTGFLVAFAVQLALSAAATGQVPENFILFAIGFLLFVIAHFVVARPMRRLIGSAWWLSPVAAVTLFAALAVNEVFIWHDLALFAFEGCWIAIGILLVRGGGQATPGPVRGRTGPGA
jgi:hypothetical protein